MLEQTRRFSRTVQNPGAVSDDLVAYAYTEALDVMHDLAMESAIPWSVRNAIIDDIGQDLGTQTEFATHRYFIESDLGITDLARPRRLWRVDTNNELVSQPMIHVDKLLETKRVQDLGAVISLMGQEGWTEDGDFNTDDLPEQAIIVYNRGLLMANGHLKVNYWFNMPIVTPDDFYEVDSSGNLTKKPPLPRKVWPAILNYAHLIILETVEDQFKGHFLWRRLSGTHGVIERVKGFFQRFEDGDPDYGDDTFGDEGMGL
jgi:hypothetical protein